RCIRPARQGQATVDSTPPGILPRHAPPPWRAEKALHLFLVYTRPVVEKQQPRGPARRQRHTLPASDTLLASSYSSYLEFVKRPEALPDNDGLQHPRPAGIGDVYAQRVHARSRFVVWRIDRDRERTLP